VGEHDFSLLRRLVLPDGSVLRCSLPGRPTADCLFRDVSRDQQTVLKVRCGAVAVFPGCCSMAARSICPAMLPPQHNCPAVFCCCRFGTSTA
jgi:hypothetical protein